MVKIVVEWNGLRRYLELPAVPDEGETLVIPSAKLADPEHGLYLQVTARRWRMTRHGSLDAVVLSTTATGVSQGKQLPRPVKDEETRWVEAWNAAGWQGTLDSGGWES